MKIPKVFIPENVNIEKLLTKPKYDYDENTVLTLLGKCEKFLWELEDSYELDKKLDMVYGVGKGLAGETSFTEWDVNELSKRIIVKHDLARYSGFYLSALVNKIIKKFDQIELEPHEELFGLGAYLKTGKLIVRGDVGYFAGAFMSGGVCIIDGNTGNRSGNGMAGGKLIIYKNAGKDTGDFMTGGEIRVDENIGSISPNCRGKMYNAGSEQLWPK